MKRLLFFVTEDWYFCSHRLPLAQAALAAGYRVSVVTRVQAHGEIITRAGLNLIPFENARAGLNPLVELGTLVRLVALYRRERPDIVHHVALKPVVYGSIAAWLVRVPEVINALAGMGWLFTSASGLARWLKPIVRGVLGVLLRRGTSLVQNPDDGRLLQELGVSSSGIRLIPGSGVDLATYRFSPERLGPVTIVLPARLLWPKGVGEFVEAARILRRRGVTAQFILAGAPDDANPSAVPTAEIQRWVSEGIVAHLGWTDDMPRVFAESHIVCLPSYYGEGIPKALIEAAAAGRPIVTTDMPGCREIVHHEENGLLVPTRDATAVADALQRLIETPALRERFGRRGRERAEQEFGIDAIVRQTLALYGGDGK